MKVVSLNKVRKAKVRAGAKVQADANADEGGDDGGKAECRKTDDRVEKSPNTNS
jgi:hypothetical protein